MGPCIVGVCLTGTQNRPSQCCRKILTTRRMTRTVSLPLLLGGVVVAGDHRAAHRLQGGQTAGCCPLSLSCCNWSYHWSSQNRNRMTPSCCCCCQNLIPSALQLLLTPYDS